VKRNTDASPAQASLAMYDKLHRRSAVTALFVAAIALLLVLPSFASADPLGATTPCGKQACLFGGFRGAAFVGDEVSVEGNVWFVDEALIAGSSAVGKITPSGEVIEYEPGSEKHALTGLNPGAHLIGIALGPEGKLWFTDQSNPEGEKTPAIAVIDPASCTSTCAATEYSTGLNVGSKLEGIAAGPAGEHNMWFADRGTTPAIGKINTETHTITEYSTELNPSSAPNDITAGPEGKLWFTDQDTAPAIGKFDPTTHKIQEFTVALAEKNDTIGGSELTPSGIAAGPDGNVWFPHGHSEGSNGNLKIDRITPSGEITPFSTGLVVSSKSASLTVGADGNLWFPDGSGITEQQTISFTGAANEQEFKLNGCEKEAKFKYKTVGKASELTTLRTRVKTAYNAICGAETVNISGGTITCGENCALLVEFNEEGSLRNTNVAQVACEKVSGTGTCSTATKLEGVASAIDSITTSGTITRYPISGLLSLSAIAYSGGNVWFPVGLASFQKIGKFGIGEEYALKVSKTGTGTGTVTSSPPGISCGGDCEESYWEGKEVELTAAASEGSKFVGWSGSGCSGTGVCKVTMSSAKEVEAKFDLLPKYTLKVSCTGTGSGTVSPVGCGSTAEYTEGTKVPLTATAAGGSEFTGWTVSAGTCTGTTSPCEVTMSSAKEVTAEFKATGPTNRRTLTLKKSAGGTGGTGSVTSKPKGINCASACNEALASMYENSTVVLKAKAATGSTIASWTGCESSTGVGGTEGTCTVTMTVDKEVKVAWSGTSKEIANAKALTLSKGKSSGYGTVKATGLTCEAECTETTVLYQGPNVEKAKPGKTVILKATSAYGSTFSGWTGCESEPTPTECSVTMEAAKSVTAEFAAKPTATLTVDKLGTGTGTVTSKPKAISCATTCTTQDATVPTEAEVILKEKPATGMTFEGWTGACVGAGETCTVSLSGAGTVHAKFGGSPKPIANAQKLTLNKAGSGYGTVKATGLTCEVLCTSTVSLYQGPNIEKAKPGKTVILKALSAPGSKQVEWTGCESEPTPTECSVTMETAKTVTATFDELP
jgi:streptogramin lyase